jgi:hypothetical protein
MRGSRDNHPRRDKHEHSAQLRRCNHGRFQSASFDLSQFDGFESIASAPVVEHGSTSFNIDAVMIFLLSDCFALAFVSDSAEFHRIQTTGSSCGDNATQFVSPLTRGNCAKARPTLVNELCVRVHDLVNDSGRIVLF